MCGGGGGRKIVRVDMMDALQLSGYETMMDDVSLFDLHLHGARSRLSYDKWPLFHGVGRVMGLIYFVRIYLSESGDLKYKKDDPNHSTE